ncbi:metallophosphoesterase, partial [bacterium]|nr:metallophosphoesterase [bacterium]
MFSRSLFLLGLALGISFSMAEAASPMLAIQVSDIHVAYQNVPAFLRALEKRIALFRQSHPNAPVLIHFNGDAGGSGICADADGGLLDLDVISTLARRYWVTVTLGNHEFDNQCRRSPNRQFGDLFEPLARSLESSPLGAQGPILAGGLALTPQGKRLFGSHTDRHLPNGKRLRVVGLALETFFQESTYLSQGGTQYFKTDSVTPYLQTLKEETLLAAVEGIDLLVIQAHESASVVQKALREYFQWRAETSQAVKVQLLYTGAGHRHETEVLESGDTRIFQAGSDYDFIELVLNTDSGKVEFHSKWSVEKQGLTEWDGVLDPDLEELSQRAQRLVADLQERGGEVLAPALVYPEGV